MYAWTRDSMRDSMRDAMPMRCRCAVLQCIPTLWGEGWTTYTSVCSPLTDFGPSASVCLRLPPSVSVFAVYSVLYRPEKEKVINSPNLRRVRSLSLLGGMVLWCDLICRVSYGPSRSFLFFSFLFLFLCKSPSLRRLYDDSQPDLLIRIVGFACGTLPAPPQWSQMVSLWLLVPLYAVYCISVRSCWMILLDNRTGTSSDRTGQWPWVSAATGWRWAMTNN